MELKRCPFCGEIPQKNSYGWYHEGNEAQEIRCENLQCKIKPCIYQDQSEYMEYDIEDEWNKRL